MVAVLAQVDLPETIGVLTGFGLVVVLPLIAILLAHQRKMADIFQGRASTDQALHERVHHLEAEVQSLRAKLDDQIIRADDQEKALAKRMKQGG